MWNWRDKNVNMKKSAKVLLTIGAIFLYILIATPIIGGMKESGQSTGLIGIILLAALIGAIRAIWKKPNEEDENKNDDSSVLQK